MTFVVAALLMGCPTADETGGDAGDVGDERRRRFVDSSEEDPADAGTIDTDSADGRSDAGDLPDDESGSDELDVGDEPDADDGADSEREPDATADPDIEPEPDAVDEPDGDDEPDAVDEPDVVDEPDSGPGCVTLPGSSVSYDGEIAITDATWLRPNSFNCELESTETVSYDVFTFCNDGARRRWDFEVEVNDDDGSLTLTDSVLFLYDGVPSLPADRLTCFAENNSRSDSSDGSLLENIEVVDGEFITVVVSGQNDFHLGTYRLNISRH